MLDLPKSIEIIEVSPRDGIQNEKTILSVDTKLALVEKALVAGARRVATAIADTDLEVLVLTGVVLEQVLAGQIPLQLRLVAMLSERGMPVPRLGTNN